MALYHHLCLMNVKIIILWVVQGNKMFSCLENALYNYILNYSDETIKLLITALNKPVNPKI